MKISKLLLFLSILVLCISGCQTSNSNPTGDDDDDDDDDVSVEVTISKTSVISTTSDDNTVTMMFTFSESIPSEIEPDVTVDKITFNESVSEKSITKAVSASDCSWNTDRTECEIEITGINNCNAFSDYSVSLTFGGATLSTTFNSADNEFDSADSLGEETGGDDDDDETDNYCWDIDDGTQKIQNGTLSPLTYYESEWNEGEYENNIEKYLDTASSENFSVSYYILENDISALTSGVMISWFGFEAEYNTEGTEDSFIDVGSGKIADYEIDISGWLSDAGHSFDEGSDDEGGVVPKEGSNVYDLRNTTAPFYICFVRRDNVVRTYVSGSLKEYILLDTNNMEILYSGEEYYTTAQSIVEYDSSSWLSNNEEVLTYIGFAPEGEGNNSYNPKIDYVRFKFGGFGDEPSAADCPPF